MANASFYRQISCINLQLQYVIDDELILKSHQQRSSRWLSWLHYDKVWAQCEKWNSNDVHNGSRYSAGGRFIARFYASTCSLNMPWITTESWKVINRILVGVCLGYIMTKFQLNLRGGTPAEFPWWLLLMALWSESDEMFFMKVVDKCVLYNQLKFEIDQIHRLEFMLILPNLHKRKKKLSQQMKFLSRSIQMP